MTNPAASHVYTIESGLSFADALAQGIIEQYGSAKDPLALTDILVLLPSRRACRTLREAFLRLSGGKAVLLPRMQPIGDVDAEEIALHLAASDEFQDILDMPPAVSRLQRQLLLARIIQKKDAELSFDQAAALALELGKFLDEVQTERLAFDGLNKLVPEQFAGHWQKTLEFLKILTHHWPTILSERGLIDHAERRNRLIEAQISHWRQNLPQYPVIAAGSTGAVPTARTLLGLVAKLPNGVLVLPGLDQEMDNASWDLISEEHPQYYLKQLLDDLSLDRKKIQTWPLQKQALVNKARTRLMSEAMRPAETTDAWRQLTVKDIPPQAMDGLSLINCTTPQEEADIIALLMRETLETPGKTAALITPDRKLARRVSLSLRRWNILVDDSGGQPLTEFPVGAWLMLVAEAAEERLSPVVLLALLKHPFMAAQIPPEELRSMVYLLDQLVLRGPRPSGGFDGLRVSIDALEEKYADKKNLLLKWLGIMEEKMQPFTTLMTEKKEFPFIQLMREHLALAERLAATKDIQGADRIWRAEAGEAAGAFFSELLRASEDIPPLTPEHYVSLLGTLLKTITVRKIFGVHPRLFILGQIEARLYCADRVILGGLNEGTWPALPAHDPWMSRPMRKQFGLPAPERMISLAAHDFVQSATAGEVFMTRARKVDGTPTVPARWLLRLETVLKAVGLDISQTAESRYRQWLKDMDAPREIKPVHRPAPKPPLEARPRKLSVTKIENWMRDPYQIYAQYILNLKALDPIDADPGGAERGTFIHAALEKFIKTYPDRIPEGAIQKLLGLGQEALADMRIPQEVEAFWWPRFEKIAVQFIEQEIKWRERAKPWVTEISGEWSFDVKGNPFILSGKADRIDKLAGGGYAIIDYKSGFTPENSDVKQGLSPQLPLEAVMLEKGAFGKIVGAAVTDLMYWRVTGSGQKPVEQKFITPRDTSVENLITDAEHGLKDLIAKFDDPNTPYLSEPRSDAKPRFSDYSHLARVREWGLSGDDGDDS